MRAIIIDNRDAKALLDKLELTAIRDGNFLRSDYSKPPTVDEMHRVFHYIVVRWLQDQGADVT